MSDEAKKPGDPGGSPSVDDAPASEAEHSSSTVADESRVEASSEDGATRSPSAPLAPIEQASLAPVSKEGTAREVSDEEPNELPRPSPSPPDPALRSSGPPKIGGPELRPIGSLLQKPKRRPSPLVVLLAGAALAAAIGIPWKIIADREDSESEEEETPAALVLDSGVALVPDAGLDAEAVDADTPVHEPQAARPKNWRIRELATDGAVELKQGKMAKRPFTLALVQSGVARPEVQRLIKALRPVLDVDHTTPEDAFTVAIDKKKKRVVAFEFALGPTEVWQAREEDGELVAKKLNLTLDRRPVKGTLAVETDVKNALERAGLRPEMHAELERAFEGHARLAEIHGGTQIRFVGEELLVDGDFFDYGDLKGVEVVLPKHARGERFYRYQGHATRGYFDAGGRQPIGGGWRTPIPFARISSRFNPNRKHPVLKVVMPHNGVDFAAPPGTPVFSTGPGVVKFAGDSGPCGNMVHVLHENGLISAYCHLQRFAAGLVVGKHVAARDLLGYVGQTGRATGPHLHFAIKKGDRFIDPLTLKMDRVKVVPESEMGEFEHVRHEADIALDALREGGAIGGAGVDAGADDDDEILDEVPSTAASGSPG